MNGVHNLRAALHPRLLELIIFPTEKCNFRCTYCYETFEVGKMKRGTIDGIKRLIRARLDKKSLEHLSLSWFGGEPTLALDVMLEIAGYAKELQASGELKGLFGSTTTNGYRLTEATLRQLVALDQKSYQISLDGYGEGHDVTRRYASGKGTFSTIWANLLSARDTELDFNILLRLHLTEQNKESMEVLVKAIIREFGGDKRFSIFFKTIENLGGPNAAKLSKMDVQAGRQRIHKMVQELRDNGFQVSAVLEGPESNKGEFEPPPPAVAVKSDVAPKAPAADGPTPALGFDGYICYASKPNSLAIRADGSVAKCTVLLEDPRNRVGTLNSDGTVKLDADRMQLWMRGFNSFDPLELGCPAQNLPKMQVTKETVVSLKDLRAKTGSRTAEVEQA